jgi:hypothetical protein
VGADRGDPLRGRIDESEDVLLPRTPGPGVGYATPQVDHLATIHVEAECGADIAVLCEVGLERVPHSLITRIYPSLYLHCPHRRGSGCRLERPKLRGMELEWEQTNVDARDPVALGRWWQEALGWVVVNDDPDEFEIRPAPDRLPGLLFARVPELKTVKNRLHLDFRPVDRDMEVERMLGLGASRADVGQGDQSWVVLADPEGNEFCILSSRRSS